MAPEQRTGWDPLAAMAAFTALAMVMVYLALLGGQQGHAPVGQRAGGTEILVVGGLVVAALLSSYGMVRAAPLRVWALVVSALVMGVLGLLALLTIGIPVLIGAILAVIAAGRAMGSTTHSPVGNGHGQRRSR